MSKNRRIKRYISASTNRFSVETANTSSNSFLRSELHLPQYNILDQLPETIKNLAMDWYEQGIRRGLKKATDLMLEDQIFKENGVLHAPIKIDINLKTRYGDEEWESRQLIISAEDIGFER
ncbi:MAG: hypothetical protein QS721_13070 [Candidatus Endonucleobacter sp. (ex Gigantidas childressi)]|nr:hypothetical protein [Candidatus Endonucleobacter sp. (ex Gigantidas childressi)]